jgi:hypothetical protein
MDTAFQSYFYFSHFVQISILSWKRIFYVLSCLFLDVSVSMVSDYTLDDRGSIL